MARATATRSFSPPRNLAREPVRLVGQTDLGERREGHHPLLLGSAPGHGQGQHHVLDDREIGDEVEALEDEAQVFAPEVGTLLLFQPIHVDAVHPKPTGARRVHRAEHAEQG